MAVLLIFKFLGRAATPTLVFICMFSPVHLEYFYIYIVNFRRMASGAFCDEEDVLEIWKFRSSLDSDNDPDE